MAIVSPGSLILVKITAADSSALENTINTLNPVMYEEAADGQEVIAVLDGHAWDDAALEVAIDGVDGGTNVTVLTAFAALSA